MLWRFYEILWREKAELKKDIPYPRQSKRVHIIPSFYILQVKSSQMSNKQKVLGFLRTVENEESIKYYRNLKVWLSAYPDCLKQVFFGMDEVQLCVFSYRMRHRGKGGLSQNALLFSQM